MVKWSMGPFIFTDVNLKKGPAITLSASYSMGSCPLAIVIAFPHREINGKLFKFSYNNKGNSYSVLYIS